MLFEAGSFNVQSRHHNLIAFSLDVGLLLKVLRSASGNDAERLEVKLVQRAVPQLGQDEPVPTPFMSFTAKARGGAGAMGRRPAYVQAAWGCAQDSCMVPDAGWGMPLPATHDGLAHVTYHHVLLLPCPHVIVRRAPACL